eukprot:5705514-Pyramimonas_sp.AAC.1
MARRGAFQGRHREDVEGGAYSAGGTNSAYPGRPGGYLAWFFPSWNHVSRPPKPPRGISNMATPSKGHVLGYRLSSPRDQHSEDVR